MSLRTFVFSASLALSFASLPHLTGCAADTTTVPAGTTDPSTPSDPNAPPEGVCSTLENVAKTVEMLEEAAEPPAPVGGTPVDGTYVVTRAVIYTGAGGSSGPSGRNIQMTVRITGNVAESNFDNVPRRAKIEVDGTNLRTTAICPSSKATDDAPFSVTPNGISLYLHDSKGTRVYFLTRI